MESLAPPQRYILYRNGILFLLIAVLVVERISTPSMALRLPLVFSLLSLCFLINAGFSLVSEKWLGKTEWTVLQLVFDSISITLFITWVNARESLFSLLYLLQIVSASLIFFRRGAMIAVASCALSFGWVMFGTKGESWWINWAVYTILFLSLGLLGGYLSEELLRSRSNIERLRSLQEYILSEMPAGLLTVDKELRVQYANPVGEQILNLKSGEMIGKKVDEIDSKLIDFFSKVNTRFTEKDPTAPYAETAVAITGPEHHRTVFKQQGMTRVQQAVETEKGKILRGDVAEIGPHSPFRGMKPFELGSKILLFQDVTSLFYLEEKLKQNEKLAAVGQLAAGIAHEIRNPLAGMSASIEMLKGSLPEQLRQDENGKLMEIALREIDRLNRLISEFLDYVKPAKIHFAAVNLPELLGEFSITAKGSKIELRTQFENNCIASGNREKLKQVALNLFLNAQQAIPNQGSIELGCGSNPDGSVSFWVADTGVGMSDEVQSHLYEPFFTTKEKGTGLGLATSYRIVESHGGELHVKSELGKGSRFEVRLKRFGA